MCSWVDGNTGKCNEITTLDLYSIQPILLLLKSADLVLVVALAHTKTTGSLTADGAADTLNRLTTTFSPLPHRSPSPSPCSRSSTTPSSSPEGPSPAHSASRWTAHSCSRSRRARGLRRLRRTTARQRRESVRPRNSASSLGVAEGD